MFQQIDLKIQHYVLNFFLTTGQMLILHVSFKRDLTNCIKIRILEGELFVPENEIFVFE